MYDTKGTYLREVQPQLTERSFWLYAMGFDPLSGNLFLCYGGGSIRLVVTSQDGKVITTAERLEGSAGSVGSGTTGICTMCVDSDGSVWLTHGTTLRQIAFTGRGRSDVVELGMVCDQEGNSLTDGIIAAKFAPSFAVEHDIDASFLDQFTNKRPPTLPKPSSAD